MPNQIPINFGLKFIIFLTLLELITVPGVAVANYFIGQSLLHVAIMGFLVAFCGIILIAILIKNWLISNSEKFFTVKLLAIKGFWYLGILSGTLLMIMFLVQTQLYKSGHNDYSAGFISGAISVGLTLIIYQGLAYYKIIAITLIDANQVKWSINFSLKNIVLLAILFGIFELIVCPITAFWISYSDVYARIIAASASGFVGGLLGSVALSMINKLLKIKLYVKLKALD